MGFSIEKTPPNAWLPYDPPISGGVDRYDDMCACASNARRSALRVRAIVGAFIMTGVCCCRVCVDRFGTSAHSRPPHRWHMGNTQAACKYSRERAHQPHCRTRRCAGASPNVRLAYSQNYACVLSWIFGWCLFCVCGCVEILM